MAARKETSMTVEAVAPCRIDLAGGTLDIYPLYLFEEGGITVNIGIHRIPTGKQDYYPAMYGGVNALWFDVAGARVEPLLVDEEAKAMLERRLILSFTGLSHFAGATNWEMMRNYIDGAGATRVHLRGIKN